MARKQVYEHLGTLVSLTNWLHNTLVIAICKYLKVPPALGEIAFVTRSSGDLSETLRAIIKRIEMDGTKVGRTQICDKIGKLNALLSRTKHVHGQIVFESSYTASEIFKKSVSFSMPSVKGGKFTRSKLDYDNIEDFGSAMQKARETIVELNELLGITQNDWMRYFNTEVEEGMPRNPVYDTPYDPPRTFP